ncbi:solute carrier family 23 protein, partial [Staphylococcus epidermidis]|uniref:solute carrier family 23 protein n=1 Tax=Staphylococcus epidermidis TaxID=1282 RepID=UPI0028CB2268
MKDFILSVQHLLAMYPAPILLPIILPTTLKFSPQQIPYLLTLHIFISPLPTFLQPNKLTPTPLPILLPSTFTALAPMILIPQTKPLHLLYPSLLISPILLLLIPPFFSYLLKFFPPLLTRTVLTIIP